MSPISSHGSSIHPSEISGIWPSIYIPFNSHYALGEMSIYKVLPSSPISYNLFEGDMLVSVDPFTLIFSQARSRSMPSSTSYELHSLKHGGGCKDGCVWPSQRCALDVRASPLQLMALLQLTSISGFEGLRLPMKRPHKLIEKSPSFSSHPLLGIGSRSASLEYKLGWDARMSVQS